MDFIVFVGIDLGKIAYLKLGGRRTVKSPKEFDMCVYLIVEKLDGLRRFFS